MQKYTACTRDGSSDSLTPRTRPDEGKARVYYVTEEKIPTAQGYDADREQAQRNWGRSTPAVGCMCLQTQLRCFKSDETKNIHRWVSLRGMQEYCTCTKLRTHDVSGVDANQSEVPSCIGLYSIPTRKRGSALVPFNLRD